MARVQQPQAAANAANANAPRSVTRWVAGVVAVATGASTVYGLFASPQIAIGSLLAMTVAGMVLLVVHRAAVAVNKKKAQFYDYLAMVLTGFTVLYVMWLLISLQPLIIKIFTGGGGPVISATNPATASTSTTAAAAQLAAKIRLEKWLYHGEIKPDRQRSLELEQWMKDFVPTASYEALTTDVDYAAYLDQACATLIP
jgi:hypothetical protein